MALTGQNISNVALLSYDEAIADINETKDLSLKLYKRLVEDSKEYLKYIAETNKNLIPFDKLVSQPNLNEEAIKQKQIENLRLYKDASKRIKDIENFYDKLKTMSNPFNYGTYLCNLYFPRKYPNQQKIFEYLSDKLDEAHYYEQDAIQFSFVVATASYQASLGGEAHTGFGTYKQLKLVQKWLKEINVSCFVFCPDMIDEFFENIPKSEEKVDLVDRKAASKAFSGRAKRSMFKLIFGLMFLVTAFIGLFTSLIVLISLPYVNVPVFVIVLFVLMFIPGIVLTAVGAASIKSTKKDAVKAGKAGQFQYSKSTLPYQLKADATDAFFTCEKGKKLTSEINLALKVFHDYNVTKFEAEINYNELKNTKLVGCVPQELAENDELFDLVYDDLVTRGARSFREAYQYAENVIRERERDAREEAFRDEMRRAMAENNEKAEASRRRLEALEEERLESARRAENLASSAAAEAARASADQAKQLAKIKKEAERSRKEIEEINFRDRMNDYNK